MLEIVLWLVMAVLSCIGFVQVVSWLAIYTNRKGNRVYKVIPIGGDGIDPDTQLRLTWASLQWESNPARQVYILYDVGLDEEGKEDCRALVRNTGAHFAENPEELLELLGL